MRKTNDLPVLFLVLSLVTLFIAVSVISAEARKHQFKNSNMHHKHQKQSYHAKSPASGSAPAPAPLPYDDGGDPSPQESRNFDVLSFGAKGDGVSDDSEALLAAWKAACMKPGATIQLPSDFRFLIKPVTLQGPCNPNLVLQIDGTLLAPPQVDEWPKASLFQWINIKWVHNFTIQGHGTVDGQGTNWWHTVSQIDHVQKRYKVLPNMKPTALRFYASYNVTVGNIRILNSPQCHLKFDNCGGVRVNNVTISAPDSSPNTDGIHLQNTRDVEIHHSNIGCGDDCVSIQTGCSNIHIHHINCGPGHGISLGGLGKDKTIACVSDIVVENITMQSTLYGARIKTWQGGLGSVKNVSFSNIQVTDVKVPIMIDQFYCDKHVCKNQTGAVAVSSVKYNQINGTYLVQPIHLACSSSIPCTDVDLIDIQLNPSAGNQRARRQALCLNSYGKSQAPIVPSSIDYCLRSLQGSAAKRTARSHERSTCW